MGGREWFANRYVLGAVALTIALQAVAVYAPGLRTVLKTVPPKRADWLVIGACALMPLVVGQVVRRLRATASAPSA